MLKVSTDGRKAALDLKPVGENQPYNACSKVYCCVQNVIDTYKNFPCTTQLIFCDYSTPKGQDFSVYAELRDKLIDAGIPEKEIAFIHSYQSESRKVALFKNFNEGIIRILIGSTFKLGIGANVQSKLKAIHHLDVPWRPADMVQREGRIIRRGNENKDVLIYRYITKGSFDSYSWQILETKQRFISQFLSGSTYQRTTSDLENNVLTYAEVKALALSQPLMKQLAEKENEAQKLRIIIAKEYEAKEGMKKELEEVEARIPKLLARKSVTAQCLGRLSVLSNDRFIEQYNMLKTHLTIDMLYGTSSVNNLKVFWFDVLVPANQDPKKTYIFLHFSNQSYIVEMGDSTEGNAKRIINKLKRFDKVLGAEEKVLSDTISRKKDLQKLLEQHDTTYASQLSQCESEIQEIKLQIDVNQTL